MDLELIMIRKKEVLYDLHYAQVVSINNESDSWRVLNKQTHQISIEMPSMLDALAEAVKLNSSIERSLNERRQIQQD